MIPIAGSAYTYSYAILGEIFAWIIGWDLILEYAVSNMSVAVGFSAYFRTCSTTCSDSICRRDRVSRHSRARPAQRAWFNVPALVITLVVTWILVRGVRESAGANNVMVLIKIAAILIFCLRRVRARSIPPTGIPSCRMDFPES